MLDLDFFELKPFELLLRFYLQPEQENKFSCI